MRPGRIESKLVQRKMLGIANPNLVSVDELRRNPQALIEARTLLKLTAGFVDITTRREIVLHLAKNAISVVARTTSAKCASLSLSQSVTQGGQDRPMEINVPINVGCMRVNEECHDDMENLTEQVQSLFYS